MLRSTAKWRIGKHHAAGQVAEKCRGYPRTTMAPALPPRPTAVAADGIALGAEELQPFAGALQSLGDGGGGGAAHTQKAVDPLPVQD